MDNMNNRLEYAARLRKRAEEIARKATSALPKSISPGTQKIIQELRVHQIELEMQNDELLQTQVKLDAERERYFDFYNLSPVGFFTVSEQGLILEANLTSATMLGVTRDALDKHPISKFILKDDGDIYYLHRKQLFNNGEPQTFELRMVKKDGTIFYAQLEAAAVENKDGNTVCRLILSDITERKFKEEARRIDQENLQAIFAAAPVGMLLLDEASMIVNSNAVIARLVCRDQERIIRQCGGSGLGCVHSFEDERGCGFSPSCGECPLNKGIQQVLQSGNSIHGAEMPYALLIDGQEHHIWLSVSAEPVLLNGRKHVVVAIDDITGRKQTEEALRLSEARCRSYFELQLTGRAISSPDKGWLEVNSTLCNMLGYTNAELTRMTWMELTHPDDLSGDLAQYNSLLAGDIEGYNLDKRFIHKDGHSVFTHLVVQCVRRPDRSVDYIVAIILDISELKQMQDELIKAKDKAEESDRLKSAFLANMSHEIRTPMNGILGFTELLKEPHLTGDEQQQYISMIEKSGDRMLNIINNIINFSKIEAGLMEVAVSATNINEQIEYMYNFFKLEVEQKGMQLSFKNTLPAKAAVIKTDREKVYAILTNLIKNAIKFTPAGSIEFGYEQKGEFLEFFVKDTGIGIPQDKQDAVFDRFVQLHIGDRRAYQGAGLGLAISNAYVKMLGGRIWVESEEGKGSVFYFTIPYNAAAEGKPVIEDIVQADIPADKKERQSKSLKILIAEDDEKSEIVIAIIVKKFTRELLKVKTGVEAVAACRNNPDIDLILMDIEMQEMDGYEATRQIRQFNKDVIIIAQTAYALYGDRAKAIAAGCNDYIAKPYNKTSLTALLKKYF